MLNKVSPGRSLLAFPNLSINNYSHSGSNSLKYQCSFPGLNYPYRKQFKKQATKLDHIYISNCLFGDLSKIDFNLLLLSLIACLWPKLLLSDSAMFV